MKMNSETDILHDKDIREPLFDFLEETFGKVRILEEKTMGRSRADIVMVLENAVAGIEIKSDADTYTRLSRQVGDYDRYFDYNYVVVGTSHAMHIEEHVPDHWGIITVEYPDGQAGTAGDRLDFYILRKAKPNGKRDMKRKLAILWREELVRILQSNGLPKYSSKNKAYIRTLLCDRVPEAVLDRQVSEELFEREYPV